MANKSLVPGAKEALNRFKMEAANEEGVQSALKKHTKKPPIARTAAHPGRLFFFWVISPRWKQR